VIGRVAGLVVGFMMAVLLVTLAVANRHGVRLVLDPFSPQNPVIFLELPFYGYLFGVLIFGVVLGGIATWMSQGKWRRLVRLRTLEAVRWKAEAERLTRERDAGVSERKRLTVVGR
jgi:hypothetical protein